METLAFVLRAKAGRKNRGGSYFITIVTKDRQALFGEVVNGEMILNEFGKVVEEEWHRSAAIRKEIELDEYVVMPDHFHAIVHIIPIMDNSGELISSTGDRQIIKSTGDRPVAPTEQKINPQIAPKDPNLALNKPKGPKPKSLGALMAGFKSSVTTRINQTRGTPGMPVWQRNYYDHIISSDREYGQIAEYIFTNPLNWLSDREYPPPAG